MFGQLQSICMGDFMMCIHGPAVRQSEQGVWPGEPHPDRQDSSTSKELFIMDKHPGRGHTNQVS